MSVIDKIKRVRGTHPVRRAAQALRQYGVREFIRRGTAKMRGTDVTHVDGGRRLAVTNESYYPDGKTRSFVRRGTVAFETAPSRDSITMLEIRTRSDAVPNTAHMRLEIQSGSQVIATGTGRMPEGDGWTTVRFAPLNGVFGQPLKFILTSDSPDAGVLVNPQRNKHGFTVDGGGSIACRVYGAVGADPYQEWISWNELSADALEAQSQAEQESTAIICVWMTPETQDSVSSFIASLRAQTWKHMRIYILCTDDLDECTRMAADAMPETKCVVLGDVSGALMELPDSAGGEFFVFADPRVVLAPHAIYGIMRELEGGADFVYADEDIIDLQTGLRSTPFFKPDISPYMLLSYNYIGGLAGVSRKAAGELHPADAYDLVLQAADASARTVHIPDVLYHVPVGVESYKAQPADIQYVEDALARRGIRGSTSYNQENARFDITYARPDPAPSVSIIIPSHNGTDMLRECVGSILEKTTYPAYEVVIIENNSTDEDTFAYYSEIAKDPRVKILTWNHPFNFASINNWAAGQTDGELLLFLNNDTSVITPDWLDRMTALASRPDVGAVGAKLLYADDTVQHGGVIIRLGGLAAHAHYGEPADAQGSFGRLEIPFDLSAVTGACLMVPRDVFTQVGGFDERFVLAYNDVDLCLKIRELGLEVLFEPRAALYHYESKTRGYEESPEQLKRFKKEQTLWIRKWKDVYRGDPFYNPNLRYDTCGFDTAPEKRGCSVERLSKPFDSLVEGNSD